MTSVLNAILIFSSYLLNKYRLQGPCITLNLVMGFLQMRILHRSNQTLTYLLKDPKNLLSFWSFLVFSADNANLSIWSCRIRAQFFNWSMIFHGVVIATHNSTVLSVKLSSVNAKRNKFECSGSPSNIQCPSRVWSEK